MFGCSLFSKSHVYKLQNIWDLVSADTCIYEHLEEKFGERPSVEYFWQTSRCLETLQSTTWIAWCTFSKESKSKENPDKKKSFEPKNRHDYYFLCFVNALLKNFVSFIVFCAVEIVCRDIEMTIFSSKWILVKKTIHVPLCGQYLDQSKEWISRAPWKGIDP